MFPCINSLVSSNYILILQKYASFKDFYRKECMDKAVFHLGSNPYSGLNSESPVLG